MPKRIALGITFFFVLLACAYATVTPAFEAPDEASHFLYIHNLLESHQLPVLEDRAAMFASGSVQRHHPPLYYLVGAALVAWTDRDDVARYTQPNPVASIGIVTLNNTNVYLHNPKSDGDTRYAVLILRLYSIALAAGTLWLIYQVGMLVFERGSVGLCAMLLVASMPSYIFISASINNDNLVTFFYTAGVYWLVMIWQRQTIRGRDHLLLGLILAGAALSKLSGLSLFGLVYVGLAFGAIRRRFGWQQAARAIIVSLGISALLAGWWYIRNWHLYGDPLGMKATLDIWSRGAPPSDLEAIRFEAKGVWESLWMVLGHFNVRGPDWLYGYVTLISGIGLMGVIRAGWKEPRWRLGIGFLLLIVILVTASLVAATRRINVSQGRILFPALVAFAPLLVTGWQQIAGRRVAPVMILPITMLALLGPVMILPDAYPALEAVDQLPAQARRVDAQAESLTLLGYQMQNHIVRPGEIVRLDLYISGSHPAAPVLFVKLLDPVTQETLGTVDTYPGMASTAALDSDTVYRVPVRFRVIDLAGHLPQRLRLAVGWRILDLDRGGEGHYLTWTGQDTPMLLLDGPTLFDPAYRPPAPQVKTDIVFGEMIRLVGYSLVDSDSITITLHWVCIAPLSEDWTVALGILDPDGQMIVQADGMPPGYPTSAWVRGSLFVDQRTLILPAGSAPGDYRVYVGWYRLADGVRLAARGPQVKNDLYFLPLPVPENE